MTSMLTHIFSWFCEIQLVHNGVLILNLTM